MHKSKNGYYEYFSGNLTLGALVTQGRREGTPRLPKKAKVGSSDVTTEEKRTSLWMKEEDSLDSRMLTRATAFRATSHKRGELWIKRVSFPWTTSVKSMYAMALLKISKWCSCMHKKPYAFSLASPSTHYDASSVCYTLVYYIHIQGFELNWTYANKHALMSVSLFVSLLSIINQSHTLIYITMSGLTLSVSFIMLTNWKHNIFFLLIIKKRRSNFNKQSTQKWSKCSSMFKPTVREWAIEFKIVLIVKWPKDHLNMIMCSLTWSQCETPAEANRLASQEMNIMDLLGL